MVVVSDPLAGWLEDHRKRVGLVATREDELRAWSQWAIGKWAAEHRRAELYEALLAEAADYIEHAQTWVEYEDHSTPPNPLDHIREALEDNAADGFQLEDAD